MVGTPAKSATRRSSISSRALPASKRGISARHAPAAAAAFSAGLPERMEQWQRAEDRLVGLDREQAQHRLDVAP
jgi:hypothetical protein